MLPGGLPCQHKQSVVDKQIPREDTEPHSQPQHPSRDSTRPSHPNPIQILVTEDNVQVGLRGQKPVEVVVVLLPHTVADPEAVMVKLGDAGCTFEAVFCPVWPCELTVSAVVVRGVGEEVDLGGLEGDRMRDRGRDGFGRGEMKIGNFGGGCMAFGVEVNVEEEEKEGEEGPECG